MVREAAIKKVHPSVAVVTWPRDQWDGALSAFAGPTPSAPFQVDKVKVAREVVAAAPDFTQLDLETQVAGSCDSSDRRTLSALGARGLACSEIADSF